MIPDIQSAEWEAEKRAELTQNGLSESAAWVAIRQMQKFLYIDSPLRTRLVKTLGSNCGTGAGGFQPGNTCAKGGASATADSLFEVPVNFKLRDAQYDVNTKLPLDTMVVAHVDLNLLSSPYENDWRVREMAGAMKLGTKFPALTLEQREDGSLSILDGRTRVAALREAGITGKVPAVIRLYDKGTEGSLLQGVVIDRKRTASLRDDVTTLGGPGSGNFGHAGRPGEVGGSAEGHNAPDLGVHDMPTFDYDDADSPEWKVLLKHDAFLDSLDEGAGDDDEYERLHEAIDAYVHAPDAMNDALRANPDMLDEPEEDPDDEDEEDDYPHRPSASLAKTARDLEDAMADAPKIRQPITVYRGLRDVTAEELATAERITLNGFQSSSFDPKIAASFMGEKVGGLAGRGGELKGVLLKIEAKYGLAFGHAHSVDGEIEMLLPHGDNYDVLGVSKVRYKDQTFSMVHLRQR